LKFNITKYKEIIKRLPVIGKIIHKIFLLVKLLIRKRNKINFIKKISNNPSELRLVLGSSRVFDKGWIPSDIEYLNILNHDHWKKYFNKESIDAMLSEHVWEHLTLEEGMIAATNCYHYLKKGGYMRIAVPDAYNPNKEYFEYAKVGGVFSGKDGHKVFYNYKSLSTLLQKVGFETKLIEYFDEHGKFHSKDWDVKKGKIHRSSYFDKRFDKSNPNWTSIIIDAKKEKS